MEDFFSVLKEALAILVPILTVAAIIGVILYSRWVQHFEEKVEKTEVIGTEPIVRREKEILGYSVGYGDDFTMFEHYRYVDVIVGERVMFKLYWKNGKVSTQMCEKGDKVFRVLVKKLHTSDEG